MADVLTPEQRKLNMSKIRGKNTTPEKVIRNKLYSLGIRGYRIHYNLPGKPDIVFVRKRIVVFIDGCFWHKCPLDFQEPETRKEFWLNKIEKNVIRDRKVDLELSKKGWTVLRIWEHEVKKDPDLVVHKIMSLLEKTAVSDNNF
ncbi:MAG TPA: very short patch repair endonuclease [Bacteroidales bacterium]|jgi:DNA mismatch endonuclease (patch repair protein)|nr:very short patch repair endonuclease [Bacteroidales bacterium]